MGFFSWLWEFFGGWFSGGTRYAEERKEERIERSEIGLTKNEEKLETNEKNMLKIIKKELMEFYRLLRENYIPNVRIRSGKQSINLDQCIIVLAQYVNELLKNKVSLRQEMQMVGNIRNYWIVAKHGISSVMSQLMALKDKNANKKIKRVTNLMSLIGKLFSEFGKELKEEEVFSQEKLVLVKQQYALMIGEEGPQKATAKAPGQTKPSPQRA